jgi:hypothetical protein
MTAPRLLVLLLAAALAGCTDVVGPEPDGEGHEVAFDLRPLFFSAGGERCVSVVDSLVLVVEDEGGARQTQGRALTPDDAVVTFFVEVEAGTVTFAAEVLSNNGAVLYAGTVSRAVEADGFSVEVPLSAVNAVLKACPARVPLPFDDGDDAYAGTLAVINRGSLPATWAADFEGPTCDGAPCFALDPSSGTTAPGDTTSATATASPATPPEPLDVRITSAVGTLDVSFAIEG